MVFADVVKPFVLEFSLSTCGYDISQLGGSLGINMTRQVDE